MTQQQLTDIFETRQMRALLEALQAGDLEQARRIEDHLGSFVWISRSLVQVCR